MKRFIHGAVCAVFLAGAAFAANPKPADPLAIEILDENGATFIDLLARTLDDPGCGKCGKMTLRAAIVHALYSKAQPNETADEMDARAELARKVKAGEVTSFSTTQVAVIKRLIAPMYGPAIIFQIIRVIAPADRPGDVK